MTKAYEDYCKTVAAEEINQQADQCFDRLDSASTKYWTDFATEQRKQTKQSPEYQRGGKPCQIEQKKFG